METEEFRSYLRESAAFILTVIEEYLRRELKVPKYSEMFENQSEFEQETKQLFIDKPNLKEKLEKLQQIIKNINSVLIKN